jgi:hypothetical protein
LLILVQRWIKVGVNWDRPAAFSNGQQPYNKTIVQLSCCTVELPDHWRLIIVWLAPINNRVNDPLVLRLALIINCQVACCTSNRVTPTFHPSIDIADKAPVSTPGTDALTMFERMDFVPTFVKRVIDPSTL